MFQSILAVVRILIDFQALDWHKWRKSQWFHSTHLSVQSGKTAMFNKSRRKKHTHNQLMNGLGVQWCVCFSVGMIIVFFNYSLEIEYCAKAQPKTRVKCYERRVIENRRSTLSNPYCTVSSSPSNIVNVIVMMVHLELN